MSHAKAGSGLDELLRMAIATMRSAAEIAGLSGDDVERRVAATLAFVRRRLTGDFTVDEFGFDEDFTEHIYLPLLRPLYKSWFRVEVRGIENIPSSGGALVVANHSGTVAFDALMTQLAVHDEHPARRHLRLLAADLVFQTPFIG
jgi:1-acyl-sn-glycerol-3-phosphate acyltransferase